MSKSIHCNDEDLCSNLWQPCKNSGVDMHTCYPRGMGMGQWKDHMSLLKTGMAPGSEKDPVSRQ